jgi:hypothetical protein
MRFLPNCLTLEGADQKIILGKKSTSREIEKAFWVVNLFSTRPTGAN